MTLGEVLRRTFDLAPEPLFLLDEEGAVQAVTERYLGHTGWARDRAVGRHVTVLPPYPGAPGSVAALAAAIESVLRTGLPASAALSDARPCETGTLFDRAFLTPVFGDGGRVTHVLHRLRVPTPELLVERRFQKLVEHNYDPIVLVDAQGTVVFASPAIERTTGYTPEEYMARPMGIDLHREDAPKVGAILREFMAQPGATRELVLRRRHKDGSFRTLEVRITNLLHDPEVQATVMNMHDVTAQLALEAELVRGREHLMVALDAARAITWDRNYATGVHVYSTDYAQFFGLPPGNYDTGPGALEAVHPDDREAVIDGVLKARDEGEFRFDFRGPDRGADTRHYSSRGRITFGPEGNVAQQTGVTWDVTEAVRLREERRVLEQNLRERQKLESLGALAGGVAHDFNNLLSTILGNANLVAEEVAGHAGARDLVVQIETAARRAADLCKQMLAYAGKAPLTFAPTDLCALIDETAALLRVSISKSVELRLGVGPGLPKIFADSTQIQQVLLNLILNASDAIGAAPGTIEVRAAAVRADATYLRQSFLAPELPEGQYVVLEVRDDGPGMSRETQERIFEPFFSTKGQGRGLGLAAVLGIIRAHRGALRLYSDVGRGTTFKLLLPVAERASSTPREDLTAPALPNRGPILLVEDEPALRAVQARMIAKLGLEVIQAADGQEALELYRKHGDTIAGVLMDLTMPRLGGEDAFKQLTAMAPGVRVVLMSGYSKHDEAARLTGEGLVGFIQKPFAMQELRKQLAVLLGE